MKAAIRDYYETAPGEDWALVIIGHAPVAYSGLLAPDGHSNHYGAWPTDTYYADMQGSWPDSSANNTSASDTRNWNVRGDGKFDRSSTLYGTAIQTGRVDMAGINEVPPGFSETMLLRQYLVRDHRFRRGLAPYDAVARRALIDNGFASIIATHHAWRNATSLFGPDQAQELNWLTVLPTTPMLYAYGEGGGSYISANGIATSLDFARVDSKAVFMQMYGSYFGDWDSPENFLRAPLAGTPGSLGLTNIWGPGISLFHMALGETVGYCTRFTQSDSSSTSSGGWYNNGRSIVPSLMGDPTLRLHTVKPPAHVTATANATGVTLSWEGSPDAVGYHVYRATDPMGPFVRLTGTSATGTNPLGSPLSATSWTDSSVVSGSNYTWLVKAVKLESTPSGSYANQSLGVPASLSYNPAGGSSPAAPTGLSVAATGTSRHQLTWRDNATDESGYEIERWSLASGDWLVIATLPANTTTFSDASAWAKDSPHYRVRATGTQANSAWSAIATDDTLVGVAQPAKAHVATDYSDGESVITLNRLHGNIGEVEVSWSTSDLTALAGRDYVASAGKVHWDHADASVRSHNVALTSAASPRLTRFFKIHYSSPTNGLALGSPETVLVQTYDSSLWDIQGWSSQIVSSATSPWPGYAEYLDGTFGLAARTGNVATGVTSDSFRFLYLPVKGDCELTVRLTDFEDELNAFPRTGIMLRASLTHNSIFKSVHVVGTAGRPVVLEGRRTSTGSAMQTTLLGNETAPYWLRLTRTGNTVRAWHSADGVNWTEVGAASTLSLPETAYVGMFISSDTQYTGMPAYVTFDQVSLEAALSVPATLTAFAGPRAGQITLGWSAAAGADHYEVQRSLSPDTGFATIATPAFPQASFTDARLTPGQTYSYRVRAIRGTTPSNWTTVASAHPYLPQGVNGWRYQTFARDASGETTDDQADPDHDGLPNLLEYALGSSPLNAPTGGAADKLHVGPPGILTQEGHTYLTLAFARAPDASGVKLTLQTTDDLNGTWKDFDPLLAANQISVENNTPLDGLQRIVASDYYPLSDAHPHFLRLQAARTGIIETGFEPVAGYAEGEPVVGVDDPFIPGTATWKNFGSASSTPSLASTANPLSGTQAVRIDKTDTSNPAGITLDLSGVGLDFSASVPITLRFSLAISRYTSGTDNQVQIYLGNNSTYPGGSRYWTTVVFTNGEFQLWTGTPTGNNTPVSLGNYTDYSELGDYVSFEITVNPATKTYTAVKVTGQKYSASFTSSLAGTTLPWRPVDQIDPGKYFQLVIGGNDQVTVDFDGFTLTSAE
jgi:regulation of enolase protein 1 (concanavalin A-like superfamily)